MAPPGTELGKDFPLSDDCPANTANRKLIQNALYVDHWDEEVKGFCEQATADLFDKYSITLPPRLSSSPKTTKTHEIDVVRDVFNLIVTRFTAELFALPLKNEENPHGIYTEQELYAVLFVPFASVFLDVDPANSFKLRDTARTVAQQLGEIILLQVKTMPITGAVDRMRDWIHPVKGCPQGSSPSLPSFGTSMLKRIIAGQKSVEDAVWGIIVVLAAAGVPNGSQLLAQCMDYYLGDGKEHLPELYRLAKLDTKEADEELMR